MGLNDVFVFQTTHRGAQARREYEAEETCMDAVDFGVPKGTNPTTGPRLTAEVIAGRLVPHDRESSKEVMWVEWMDEWASQGDPNAKGRYRRTIMGSVASSVGRVHAPRVKAQRRVSLGPIPEKTTQPRYEWGARASSSWWDNGSAASWQSYDDRPTGRGLIGGEPSSVTSWYKLSHTEDDAWTEWSAASSGVSRGSKPGRRFLPGKGIAEGVRDGQPMTSTRTVYRSKGSRTRRWKTLAATAQAELRTWPGVSFQVPESQIPSEWTADHYHHGFVVDAVVDTSATITSLTAVQLASIRHDMAVAGQELRQRLMDEFVVGHSSAAEDCEVASSSDDGMSAQTEPVS